MTLLYNPRQAVLVTCRTEKDHDIITCTWHTPVSNSPAMYAIVLPKGQSQRILETNVFVVNFLSHDKEELLVKAAHLSPELRNKRAALGISTTECEKVDCFRITDEVGWMECEVKQQIPIGNNILIIGSVINSMLIEEDKRPFHVEGDKYTRNL